VRNKPNTTAVDGTSVTGVNFFTPFFGTSASAPHAAAVAVLLKDVDPGLGPRGIARILRGRRWSAAIRASTRRGASA
jgi:subtilisin family serine protease